MISLLSLNKSVCTLYQQVLDAAGTGAKLVAEDVRAPIIRPSGKVELEDGADGRLFHSGRERRVTFRLYYFASSGSQPKFENLAVRSAVGEAFLDGIYVDGTYLGIDDGISFTVVDGVLVGTMDLTIHEEIPEAPGELMETLKYDTEVN